MAKIWANPAIVLFHGTTQNHVASLQRGVNVQIGLIPRDFGPGFYTTTSQSQAMRWAKLKAARFNQNPAIVRFTVNRDDLAQLDFMAFVRKDTRAIDFWHFVQYCRLGYTDHGRSAKQGCYDIIAGPVVKRWRRAKTVYRDYDQVSFHTQAAADLLNRSAPKELP